MNTEVIWLLDIDIQNRIAVPRDFVVYFKLGNSAYRENGIIASSEFLCQLFSIFRQGKTHTSIDTFYTITVY